MATVAQGLEKNSIEATATELQAMLVKLIDLSLKRKQAHSNVTGSQFRAVHLERDEVNEHACMSGNETPERLRAPGSRKLPSARGLESWPEGITARPL